MDRERPGVSDRGELLTAQRAICSAGRRMWLRRLCSGHEGNLSARLSDGSVVCTPTGVSKSRLRREMLLAVTPDGATATPAQRHSVTSEIKVHLAIYRSRPDVRAVVHGHPPHATTFAIAEVELPFGLYPPADVVLGRVPLVPYAPAGTSELSDNVASCLDDQSAAVLLARHGAVAFSRIDVDDAYLRLEVLESYCEMLLHRDALRRSASVGISRRSGPACVPGGV